MAVPPKAFEQAYGSLWRGGTLVFVGLPADNHIQLPIFETVLNGTKVLGSIVGTRTDLQAHAGMTSERGGGSRDEAAARLLNDASIPEGWAYPRAFSEAATARPRELRGRDPLPEPDRTPGAPHPDPFLAGRAWQLNKHGRYSRTPEPQPAPTPEKDLEAG